MDKIQFDSDKMCIQDTTIYIKPDVTNLSSRKLKKLQRISELQKYYQRNPIKFIEDFFNFQILDYQKWVLQRSWTCPNVLLLFTRGGGKSFIVDVVLMAKGMLFNNYWSYIASGSGAQAQQTFTALERLANDNIDTMVGSSGYIFKDELVVPNANGDGFSHNVDGYKYTLYNGSQTLTLNSNVDSKRGIFELVG